MSTTTPARVVVVDDSALMRNIVTRSLTRAGVEVVGSARDGDEALALCERERPDAMTLDLTMPGLDGLGVLRALRARAGSNIPVVVVSAFSAAHGARAVDALAEGAFDLVSKPTANEGLEAFIENLGAKVKLAVASRRTRRPAHSGLDAHADPIGPRRPRGQVHPEAVADGRQERQAGPDRHLHRRPAALAALVPKLPAPLGVGTLIVQHMPAGLHRIARGAPRREQRAERPRGRRRRDARRRAPRCSRREAGICAWPTTVARR